MSRSRGGLTTKVHALTDARGFPIRLALTPGQTRDIRGAAMLLDDLMGANVVLADKAYDADAIRERIEAQGAAPNIPDRSNRKERHCFSKALYKERNRIEGSEIGCHRVEVHVGDARAHPNGAINLHAG